MRVAVRLEGMVLTISVVFYVCMNKEQIGSGFFRKSFRAKPTLSQPYSTKRSVHLAVSSVYEYIKEIYSFFL